MNSADLPPRHASSAGRPAVSVVVPCRNERDHVEACVRSIMGQEDVTGGFEVIVVDGMSDDGTREILAKLADEFEHLTVIDNPRQITPVAMNIGIRHARGENIAILGAHTVYDPQYLATCQQMLDEHPEVVGVGGPIRSRGKSAFGRAVARAMSHPLGIGNAWHRHPDYEGYAEEACFPVYRRVVFERHGLYDESLVRNQDDEFCQRIAHSGERVFISHRATSEYFVRETPAELFRQYFHYGLWRMVVLRLHKAPYSVRQIVPATFFALVVVLILVGSVMPSGWRWLAIVLPALYAAVLLVFSLSASYDSGGAVGLRFPLAVLILHAAYATGFIYGLWTDPRTAMATSPAQRGSG